MTDPRTTCKRKVRYPSRREAKKYARHCLKLRHEKVYPFECDVCQGWHVGHDLRRGQIAR